MILQKSQLHFHPTIFAVISPFPKFMQHQKTFLHTDSMQPVMFLSLTIYGGEEVQLTNPIPSISPLPQTDKASPPNRL